MKENAGNTFGTGTNNLERIEIASSKNYNFNVSVGLQFKAFEGDPYYYRTIFEGKLLEMKKEERPIFLYEVSGTISCPEWNLRDYLYLTKQHLLFPLLRNVPERRIREDGFEFKLDPFRWQYSPKKDEPDDEISEFKERTASAFSNFIRNNEKFQSRAREVIGNYYSEIGRTAKNIILEHKDDLPTILSLTRQWGVYDKQHTTDILDLVFGNRWSFYHGEDVIIDKETGTLLIPNFWVKYIDGIQSGVDPLAFAGYGMRTGVVEFGFDPYPWTLIRVNSISNSIENIIRDKVSFGPEKAKLNVAKKKKTVMPRIVNCLVYIIGLRGERIVLKKLSKEYISNMDFREEGKLEVVTGLALGQLEADEQEREKKV
jgi:hypothetical protein